MTDRHDDQFDPRAVQGGVDPEALSAASRLRAAADAEIPEPEGLGDADRTRLAFERELKESVARVMREPAAAPPGLRDSVSQILASGISAAASDVRTSNEAPVGRGHAAHNGLGSSDRSFWSGGPRMWMSLAAALLLVASAALLLQVASVPNGFNRGAGQASATIIEGVGRAELVGFMADEHDRCATFTPAALAKFSVTTLDQACEEAGSYLRTPLDPDSLLPGHYTFAGYGPCRVPGGGKSVHMIYRTDEPGFVPISLFIQERSDRCRLDEGRTYIVSCKESPSPLFVWRRGGLIFYLVSPDQTPAESVPADLGAPDEVVRI